MAHRAGGHAWDQRDNDRDGLISAQDLLVDLDNEPGATALDDDDNDDDDDEDDDGRREGDERQPLLAPSSLSTASSHHTSGSNGDYALADLHPSSNGGSHASSATTQSLFEGAPAPMQAQTSLSTRSSSVSPADAAPASHARRKQRQQSLQPQQSQRHLGSSRLARSQDLPAHGSQRSKKQRPRTQTLQHDPEKEKAVVISLERLEHELVHLRTLCAPASHPPQGLPDGNKPRRRRRRWLSKRVTHRLLLMTIIWQVLNVGILTLLDRRIPEEKIQDHFLADPAVLAGVIIMVVFQTIHMIVIVISSIKLAKQILHHTASNSFLVQSYLSTIVLYAGVYTLLFRIDKNTFQGVEDSLETVSSKGFIFLCFMKFLYFSVATMTSTGFGDITPKTWYMDAIVSSQMLISIVYTTSIFAKGLTIIAGSRANAALEETSDDEESAKPNGDVESSSINTARSTSDSRRQTRAINSSVSSTHVSAA